MMDQHKKPHDFITLYSKVSMYLMYDPPSLARGTRVERVDHRGGR